VVAGNARHEQRAEERRITHGERRTEIRQDDHLTVQGSRHVRAANHRLSAQHQVNVSACQNIVIDGGASTTIQAGGVWITINAVGIFSSVPVAVGGVPKSIIAATPVMLDASEPPRPEAVSAALLKRLLGDEALVELCQMPAGYAHGLPAGDCQCRKALGYGDRT
jgi:type VI secretion system secreted protein VgrG